MNLGKNINNLLKRYTEVYVKGLGVFKRKHSAAQLDKNRELFLPPISYVEFDAAGENGFNFVHYIQQQQNLNQEAATKILADAVADLKDQLIQNGQAKLEDLGHIVSYGSSLVFKPLDLSGFNFEPIKHVLAPTIETVIPDRELEEITPYTETAPDSALSAEVLPDLEVVATTEDVADPEDEKPLVAAEEPLTIMPVEPVVSEMTEVVPQVNETVEPVEEEVEQVDVAETEPIVDEAQSKSNSVWYYISAIIIIVVSIGLAFLLNPSLKEQLFGKKQSSRPALVTPVDSLIKVDTAHLQQDMVLPTDSLKLDSVALVEEADVVNTAETEPEVDVKVSTPVAQPGYQLVIATPRTMELAQAEVARLRNKGYTSVSAVDSKIRKNKKRVIWKTYVSKDEADRDQVSVAKNFPGAWVEKIGK